MNYLMMNGIELKNILLNVMSILWADNRTVLNGILWILRSGAPWRDLPERYGKWNTIYKRFCLWQQNGLFEKIFSELITDADFQEICIDSSMCKVHQSANGVKKR